MKIKIGVLEDELDERLHLEEMLQRFFLEVNISYELIRFNDSQSFLSSLNQFKDFQLLLMDIILPGNLNGVDLAREVRKVNKDIAIVFITKTAQFAINGYEVDALDYVLKPLVYEEFSLKLKKAMRYILLHSEKFITLKHKNGVTRIGESRIYYVEVILHYLIVHTMNGEYTVRGTIRDMEKLLSGSFIRCNNSYIVNLRHIESIEDNLIVIHGNKIPITRSRKNDFYKAFNAYNGVL